MGRTETLGIPVWLQWVNPLSQLGLLITAIVVYVFTVIPVYKLGVLEEDVAKKQLELKTAQAALDQKEREFAKVSNELEASYATVRRFDVRSFVFTAGFKCSSLGIPPRDLLTIGSPPHKLHIDELLELPVAACLRTELAVAEKRKVLRLADMERLHQEVERIILLIAAKREEVARAYAAMRPKVEAEQKALLARPRITDDRSLREALDLRRMLEESRKIQAKPRELEGQYDGFIRAQLSGLNDIFGPVSKMP
jgi:hypothetical protein